MLAYEESLEASIDVELVLIKDDMALDESASDDELNRLESQLAKTKEAASNNILVKRFCNKINSL